MPIATPVLAGLAIASAVSNYRGQRSAADGAVKQGNYQASIFEQNAAYADTQSADALALGKTEEDRHKAEVRKLIGSQRAAIGASGIALDSGSAADLQAESATMGRIDELTIRNNAHRAAYGFDTEAAGLRAQANLARLGGQNTAKGIRNQAVSTLIGSAVQVSNMFPRGSGLTVPKGAPSMSNIYGNTPYVLPKMPRVP